VFPNANGKQWNDGRETTRSASDDVAFLVKLVQQVTAESGGDPRRVFVTGVSNGGMMTQRLICEAADVVAAGAVVIANMPADLAAGCRPKRPVPVVFFNGVADPLMPWAGGEIRKAPGLGVGGKAMSTPATIAFWARANGCRNEQAETLPDRADDGTRVKLHTFESCSGAAAQLYEIEGGGHTWPGGPEPKLDIVRRIVGTTSKDIDATQAILYFFSKYGL
jgi:polyhydroxybutyrate depolymerase